MSFWAGGFGPPDIRSFWAVLGTPLLGREKREGGKKEEGGGEKLRSETVRREKVGGGVGTKWMVWKGKSGWWGKGKSGWWGND